MKKEEGSKFIEVFLMRQAGTEESGNPAPREAHRLVVTGGDENPVALEVLFQAREGPFPDLAFRYGCRNQRCGLCAIEINGSPDLACRAKVSDGDKLAPLSSLPVVRDFVVDRSGVDEQILGKIPGAARRRCPGRESPNKHFVSLSRCIECYACLKGCPLHEKNLEVGMKDHGGARPTQSPVHVYGNPCTFLKLKRHAEDEELDEEVRKGAISQALDFGLEMCLGCYACRCRSGIDLVGEVIKPLLVDGKATDKV